MGGQDVEVDCIATFNALDDHSGLLGMEGTFRYRSCSGYDQAHFARQEKENLSADLDLRAGGLFI